MLKILKKSLVIIRLLVFFLLTSITYLHADSSVSQHSTTTMSFLITEQAMLAPRITSNSLKISDYIQAFTICRTIEGRSPHKLSLNEIMSSLDTTDPLFKECRFETKLKELYIYLPNSALCIRYFNPYPEIMRDLPDNGIMLNAQLYRQISVLTKKLYPDVQQINPAIHPSVKAVVFDFDGTIADTIPHILRAFGKIIYAITQATSDIPPEDYSPLAAKFLDERQWQPVTTHINNLIQEAIQGGVSQHQLTEIMTQLAHKYNIIGLRQEAMDMGFAQIYEAALLNEIKTNPPQPFPGARQFLYSLYQSGIRMYIATGTTQTVVEYLTQQWGIDSGFDVIYGVPTDRPYGFSRNKTDILEEVKNNLGLSAGEIAIVGDSRDDMRAAKNPSLPANERFVAIGISNEQSGRDLLANNGADFLIPGLSAWQSLWNTLSISLPTLTLAMPKNRADGLPFQFAIGHAVKGGTNLKQLKSTAQEFATFKSSIIEQVQALPDSPSALDLNAVDFNQPFLKLFPIIRYALETDSHSDFMRIINSIIESQTLSPEQKKESFLTIMAWSKHFPASIKRENYCAYSFEMFAQAVQEYQQQHPQQLINVGELGSGDGLAIFQYKNLLRMQGIKADYTQFEIDQASIDKSRLFNQKDTFVAGDLANLPESEKAKYRAKFDVIMLNNVMHELFAVYGEQGIKTILSSAAELLKPGGVLVFRDGIYPQNGGRYTRIAISPQYEEAFLFFQTHYKFRTALFPGIYDNEVVLPLGDLAKFLTKIKFIEANKLWEDRYGIEGEMHQVYCFANIDDYNHFLTDAGFHISEVTLGNEQESLALWKKAVPFSQPFFMEQRDEGGPHSPISEQRRADEDSLARFSLSDVLQHGKKEPEENSATTLIQQSI
ncbi:MAG: HAD family hydrolase [Candidatus Omnitrophota bacterium]